MENQIQIVEVQGVHGFVDEKGVAWLNIEDIARGLGFVQVQEKFSPTSGGKSPTSGGKIYESIRWERINGYLTEYDYPPVKAGDFIPENIFYLLAMKASNETAKAFQLKIANEILPSIRRTGSYSLMSKKDAAFELERDRLNFERDRLNFERDRLNFEHDRLNFERDRLNFEREQFNLANSEESKKMAKVQLIRELASASKDDFLRYDLVQYAAKLLIGEDFDFPTWNSRRIIK